MWLLHPQFHPVAVTVEILVPGKEEDDFGSLSSQSPGKTPHSPSPPKASSHPWLLQTPKPLHSPLPGLEKLYQVGVFLPISPEQAHLSQHCSLLLSLGSSCKGLLALPPGSPGFGGGDLGTAPGHGEPAQPHPE